MPLEGSLTPTARRARRAGQRPLCGMGPMRGRRSRGCWGGGRGHSGEGPRRVGGPLPAPGSEAALHGDCGERPGWVESCPRPAAVKRTFETKSRDTDHVLLTVIVAVSRSAISGQTGFRRAFCDALIGAISKTRFCSRLHGPETDKAEPALRGSELGRHDLQRPVEPHGGLSRDPKMTLYWRRIRAPPRRLATHLKREQIMMHCFYSITLPIVGAAPARASLWILPSFIMTTRFLSGSASRLRSWSGSPATTSRSA
jgi:hypothetical protein